MLSIATSRRAGVALLVVLAAVASPVALAGKVYKWVDEQGRVHYGERPGGADASTVDVTPANRRSGVGTTSSERRALQKKLLDAYDVERAEKRAAKARQQAEAEQLRKNCEQSRADLARLEFAQYLYRKGPKGEQVVLSDAERSAYIARLKGAIKRHCLD